MKIPSHIAWPASIIALFVASSVSSLSMIWIARSDGGAQVIDRYYEKAAAWNETMADEAASRALGWQVRLSITPSTSADRTLELIVQDHDAQPVSGLEGILRASRPQYTGVRAETDLVEIEPGVYRQNLELQGFGLWDFEVEAERDEDQFRTTIRKEVR